MTTLTTAAFTATTARARRVTFDGIGTDKEEDERSARGQAFRKAQRLRKRQPGRKAAKKEKRRRKKAAQREEERNMEEMERVYNILSNPDKLDRVLECCRGKNGAPIEISINMVLDGVATKKERRGKALTLRERLVLFHKIASTLTYEEALGRSEGAKANVGLSFLSRAVDDFVACFSFVADDPARPPPQPLREVADNQGAFAIYSDSDSSSGSDSDSSSSSSDSDSESEKENRHARSQLKKASKGRNGGISIPPKEKDGASTHGGMIDQGTVSDDNNEPLDQPRSDPGSGTESDSDASADSYINPSTLSLSFARKRPCSQDSDSDSLEENERPAKALRVN